MDNIRERYSINASGLPEIVPVRQIAPPSLTTKFTPVIKQDVALPFTQDNKVLIRDSVPVWDHEHESPDDANDIAGIVIYELTPDRFSIIYCHTSKLEGFLREDNKDGTQYDICDYYDVPAFNILENLANYVGNMIATADQMLVDGPHMPHEKARGIIGIMEKLSHCSSKDFTIDIYVPDQTCALTGELYLRPGTANTHYNGFNNPDYDEEHHASKAFIQYLREQIITELPKNGLKASYDRYAAMVRQYGNGDKNNMVESNSAAIPPRQTARPLPDAGKILPPQRRAMRPWIPHASMLTYD